MEFDDPNAHGVVLALVVIVFLCALGISLDGLLHK
jgi:hypothetical protein